MAGRRRRRTRSESARHTIGSQDECAAVVIEGYLVLYTAFDRNFAALRSASLTRVCQPVPVARK